ncbi:MAG: hypothetical protein ACYCOR_20535 [Acidobacteriaceae bacterium]
MNLRICESGVGTAFVDAVDEETIREYIENRKLGEDGENFKITAPLDLSQFLGHTVKTMHAVRCKFLDRQANPAAFSW